MKNLRLVYLVILIVLIGIFFVFRNVNSIGYLGPKPGKDTQQQDESEIKIKDISGKITDILGSTCASGKRKRLYVPLPFITDKSGCIKDLNGDGIGDIQDFLIGGFRLMLGLGAILTVFMLTYGGFKWIFSGGNPQKINEAKDIIFSSIGSLILIFLTIPIIEIINPALLNIKLDFGRIKLKEKTVLLEQMCDIREITQGISYVQLSEPNKTAEYVKKNKEKLKKLVDASISKKDTYEEILSELPKIENSGKNRCGALQAISPENLKLQKKSFMYF